MTFPRTLAAVAAFILAACSSPASSEPAGASCSSSSACESGLTCSTLSQFSDAGCTSVGTVCSKTCQADSDCASLGSKYKCFASCSGASTCGQTM